MKGYRIRGSYLVGDVSTASLANATGPLVNEQIAPPVFLNQILAPPWADYLRRWGADRFFARMALSRVYKPDLIVYTVHPVHYAHATKRH